MHDAPDGDLAAELLIQAQKAVGQRLRALRADRQLSQADVARHAGVHQSQWCRLEAGEIDPRLSWLLRAQLLFGFESLESLFGPTASRRLLGANGEQRSDESNVDAPD